MENIWNSLAEWRSWLSREARLCVLGAVNGGEEACSPEPSYGFHIANTCQPNFLPSLGSLLLNWSLEVSMFNWTESYFTLKKGKMFLLFCLDFLVGLMFDMDPGHCNFLQPSYHGLSCLKMFLNSQHFSPQYSLLLPALYYRPYFSFVTCPHAYSVITAVLYAYYYFSFAGTSLWIAECNLWNMTIIVVTPVHSVLNAHQQPRGSSYPHCQLPELCAAPSGLYCLNWFRSKCI